MDGQDVSCQSWFVVRGERTEGPFETSQMIAAALDGRLNREHWVWTDGQTGWERAGTIPTIFPLPPPLSQSFTTPVPLVDRQKTEEQKGEISDTIEEWACGNFMSKAISKQDRIARAPLTILLINAALLALWSAGLAPRIAAEDGVLETMQLLLAAGACSIFMFAALEDDGPVGTAATAIAAIAAIAVIREIDVHKIVVPDWMMIWSNGSFRDTTVAILILLVIGYLWWRREHVSGWKGLLLRKAAWPFWLSGILLTSSLAFDGDKVNLGPASMLIEEFAEFNGFMLLLVAGWRHSQLLIDRRCRAL